MDFCATVEGCGARRSERGVLRQLEAQGGNALSTVAQKRIIYPHEV